MPSFIEKIKGGHFIMPQKDLEVIQEKIGYKFNNEGLLLQAFVRTSFVEENEDYEDNEKLEFIGDKVLDLIAVKKLAKIFGNFIANKEEK